MTDFVDITTAVKTLLLSKQEITSIIGQRMELDWYPTEAPYPGVVIHMVSSNAVHDLSGVSGLCTSLIQFDCYSYSSVEAKKIDHWIRKFLMKADQRKVWSGITIDRVIDEGKRDFTAWPIDGSQKWRACRQHDFSITHDEEIP